MVLGDSTLKALTPSVNVPLKISMYLITSSILYIKVTVSVSLSVFYLFFTYFFFSGVIPLAPVLCGVFWGMGEGRARWSMGRGAPPPPSTGRGRTRARKDRARGARAKKDRARGRAQARKDRTRESSTGTLCTRFTLVLIIVAHLYLLLWPVGNLKAWDWNNHESLNLIFV
jgi:hypothetical protein